MASGQYVIPGMLTEAQRVADFSAGLDAMHSVTETQPVVAEVQNVPFESSPVAHEAQPTPFHFIKEIENRLDSYRETAVMLDRTKRPWLQSMKSIVLSPKPPLAELIEKESKIGGRLFQKVDAQHELRFWCEGREWFFGWTDGHDVSIVDSTVHYQVFDNLIQKSYLGRVVPFAQGEEAHFLNAVQAYERAVIHELYPFDEAFVELTAPELLEEARKDDYRRAA